MINEKPTYRELENRVLELEAKLAKTEWLNEKDDISSSEPYIPFYGDVTELNTARTILHMVGKETLKTLTSELMDLLDTSVAIYEKNGDYAYGEFDSGWCQLMDAFSRKLCNTEDNKVALNCGKWLCHDDCWKNSAKAAIESGKSTDINCIGGIKLYAEPIFDGEDVIGVINMGYGNPPTDEIELKELSDKYKIPYDTLKEKSLAYKPRPDYIIQIAKKRLKSIALLIGEMISRKKVENKLQERVKELNCISELSILAREKDKIDDILSEFVYILKQSMQFPDITEVQINNKGYSYQTENYKKTKWEISNEIIAENLLIGNISVVYLDNPTHCNNPLLEEEYSLLNIIAEQIGKIIERLEKAKRYQELFNTVYEGIVKVDKNGIITEANSAMAALCGYEYPDELIGMPVKEFYVSPNDRNEYINELKQNGVLHNLDFLLKKKDGTVVQTLGNIKMLFNRNGVYVGTLGSMRDVTDRKKTEHALKQNEKKYRALFESANDAIFLTDAESGIIIDANSRAESLLGCPRDEIIGMHQSQLHPADIAEKAESIFNEHFEKGDFRVIDFLTVENKSGDLIPVEISPSVVHINDKVYVYGMFRDISKRKRAKEALQESEELFRSLFESSKDAIMFGEPPNRYFISCNKATLDMFCVNDESEFTKMNPWMLSPEKQPDGSFSKDRASIEMQKAIENGSNYYEWVHKRINGQEFYATVLLTRINLNGRTLLQANVRDISEQKNLQIALKESEEKYKRIINKSIDVIWTQDLSFNTTYMSQSVERMLGYTVEEYLSMPVRERLPESSVQIAVKELTESLQKIKNGEANVETYTFTFEMLHKHKNGKLLWGEVNCSFLYDEKKNITGVHGITRNIDDRKKAENEIIKSVNFVKALLNAIPTAVFYKDIEGKYIGCNQTFTEIMGVTGKEIKGKTVFELWPNENSLMYHQKDLELINNPKKQTYDFSVIDKNGISRPVIFAKDVFYDEQGNAEGIVGSFLDITDRKKAEEALKESEEKYKTLFESNMDSIAIFRFDENNKPSKFIDCNKTASDIIGLTKEELLNISPFDIEIIEDFTKVEKRINEIRTKGISHFESKLKHKDGHVIFVEIIARIVDYMGNPAVMNITRDITDRKKAEIALKKSEENFRNLFEVIDDIIVVANSDGRIVYGNKALPKKLGYTTDELLKMHVLDLNIHEKRKEAEKIFAAMFRGEIDICLLPLQRKDGTYLPAETKVWFGTWNGENCIFGLVKDLSEQQALLDKFRKIFDRNPNLMALNRIEDDICINVNNTFLEKLGYSREEIIGKTTNELGLFVQKDIQNEIADELKKTGRVKNIELKVKAKDGRILDGLFFGEIIENQFEKSILTEMVDITDRKKAEIALKDNVAKLESLVAIYQKEHKNKMELLDFTLNEAVELTESQIGYVYFYDNETEEFTLHSWSKNVMKECTISNPDRMYNLEKTGLWGEAVRQRKPIMVNDFNAPNQYKKGYPEGHAKLNNFLTIPVFQNNEIVAVVGVANKKTDYTQTDILHLTILMENTWAVLQKFEKDEFIKLQNKELKKLNADKDRFMSILAHDLRAPFNSLIGFSDLLMEVVPEDEDNEINEYATIINNTLNNTLNYLNNLLDWARLQENKMEFEPTHLSLNELLEVVVRYLSLQAESKKISISTNVPDDMTVYADKNMLQIILINLISNAIKYTNVSGKIEIVSFSEKANNIITVEDNGIGMSKEVSELLFKVEESFSTPGTENELGTGLGLVLCKEFVDKHSGQIEVESELNKGSKFIIKLPKILV
jgi:PAS domain S-box-containing protein